MKPSVEQLFSNLKGSTESVQNETVAQLAMLLERHVHPDRQDPTWKLVLSDELLALRLSPEETKEVISEAVSVTGSGQLCRSSKLSLIGVIARNADTEGAETLLRCFSEFAETFSEQEAFSFLATFADFLLRVEDVNRIQPLLAKYNTVPLLERLQGNGSTRLQEAAVRVLNHLRRSREK